MNKVGSLFLQCTNVSSIFCYPRSCKERTCWGCRSAFSLRVWFSVCSVKCRRSAGTRQLAYFVQSFSTDLMSAAWSSIIKERGLCCVDLSLLPSLFALWCPCFHSLQTNDQYPGTCRVRLRVCHNPLQHQMMCGKNKMYGLKLIFETLFQVVERTHYQAKVEQSCRCLWFSSMVIRNWRTGCEMNALELIQPEWSNFGYSSNLTF